MKILVINYEYPPVGGGGGEVSKYLSEGFASREHQVLVITAHFSGLKFHEYVSNNLEIIRVRSYRKSLNHCSPFQMFIFMFIGYLKAQKYILKWKPDIIQCHFLIPSAPIGFLLKVFTKTPYIITLHGGDVPGSQPKDTGKYFKLIMPIVRIIANNAEHCVFVSKWLLKLSQGQLKNTNGHYIQNGVDIKLFNVCEKKCFDKKINIVFAGRFSQEKSLHRIIEAAKVLKSISKNPFEINLFGGGPLEGELRGLAQRLDVVDVIRFRGWIKREELSIRLREADIFCLPSDIEGMPIACLQAMASGLAVVGSRTTGIEEVVRDGENGLLSAVGDVDALAGNLARLIDDPELTQKMGRMSREIAEAEFSWEKIVDDYLALFQKIIRKS